MMEVDLNAIKENVIEATAEIASSKIAIPYNELRAAAKNFLKNITAIYHSGNIYRSHSNGDPELMRLWSIYRDKNTSRALALLQNNFAVALDSFLERKIVLTYVTKEGELMLYSEEGEMQILEAVGKNAGRANFSSGAWKNAERLKELPAELKPGSETDLIQKINESTAKRSYVYQTSLIRYNEVQRGKIHTKEKNRYYWLKSSDPNHSFPDSSFSRGEIAEAYANAVIKDDNRITSGKLESSLKVLYDNYIKSHKDNIAAILKGDVSVGRNGKISLAVKGQSASTAKIGQYIVAAYYINQMESLSKEDLKKWLTKEMPSINELVSKVEQEAKEKGEEKAFETILEELTKDKNFDII